MPANLTPQYYEAEKAFRKAKTVEDKMEALEEMLAVMPKHKGTDHLKAELRRRIAKLAQSAQKKSATQKASLFVIEKEGAAQVAIVGPPNAGKSQLVDSVTNASPNAADYPFTTQQATPGMMPFENIQIQLIDTPPLAPQAVDFWMPHMLRRADALLLLVDLSDDPLAQTADILAQLEEMRVKVGQGEGKALLVGNKLDSSNAGGKYAALKSKYGEIFPLVAISATDGTGLEELKGEIYRLLDIIRVYTKTPGQKPDFSDPIILDSGSTLEDAAAAVHKDFRANLKYARLWGSGKHDGLRVKRDHILQDGDVIELHL